MGLKIGQDSDIKRESKIKKEKIKSIKMENLSPTRLEEYPVLAESSMGNSLVKGVNKLFTNTLNQH